MKLLLLDFDGVMTNGTKAYGRDGKCRHKVTADIDWTAIKLFIAKGWQVAFISSDEFNKQLCHDRGIHFIYSRNENGTIDKPSKLPQIIHDYGLSSVADIVYCGDDATDWPIMKIIKEGGGRIFSPMNASGFIKKNTEPLCCNGGNGAIEDLFYVLFGDPTEDDIMKVQY